MDIDILRLLWLAGRSVRAPSTVPSARTARLISPQRPNEVGAQLPHREPARVQGEEPAATPSLRHGGDAGDGDPGLAGPRPAREEGQRRRPPRLGGRAAVPVLSHLYLQIPR